MKKKSIVSTLWVNSSKALLTKIHNFAIFISIIENEDALNVCTGCTE